MTEQRDDFGFRFDNSYLTLPSDFYKEVALNHVSAPGIVILNLALAENLNLNADELSKHGVAILAGDEMPNGAAQIAQAYAGHQFGHFNMLGDGRALLIGEHITDSGERVDLQLKGSGLTPFSRGGDGRAALGPMLREFIMSEAMFALGIPTTRSLAIASTGDPIYREKVLEGAVLTRVAASHLRVGTFQYAASFCEKDELKALADYAIERHYPELKTSENRYVALLEAVLEKQAALIAKWQSVGFIHGVMNTDNVTISGETIDYGPCAFMDTFDPATVFSSIDKEGRYAYGNQPAITAWNMTRFAESLLPIFHEEEDEAISLAQQAIEKFPSLYEAYYFSEMREKLGLLSTDEDVEELILNFLQLMERYKVDYTNTFRALSDNERPNNSLFESKEFKEWEKKWFARIEKQGTSLEEVYEVMQAVNPIVIPRNHRVEEAIEAFVEGDPSYYLELLQVLTNPFNVETQFNKYKQPPNDETPPFVSYCGT
ncbi:YdiU family protein [Lysinibacillus sp. 2017]|uniref:protein adenylyltransferase SelO n=1 Tax=unclassified Lysinibacillus TaxID=2636778 RepID=UPI000D526BA5|nr:MULTISPECIES: YdiU family protein [unclassified Lysinibacillus]AWE08204.1 YdiU family protein [Lysinibacillus sp. 2017]TGN36292.1 YdiU family protein [Lysinibacillus sp. S2017]